MIRLKSCTCAIHHVGRGSTTGNPEFVLRSANARRLRLEGAEQIAGTLHRNALVIEAKAIKPAQLLARPGAAGTTVIALWHDNAVPGVGGRNSRIDSEDAAVARAELGHHPQQERPCPPRKQKQPVSPRPAQPACKPPPRRDKARWSRPVRKFRLRAPPVRSRCPLSTARWAQRMRIFAPSMPSSRGASPRRKERRLRARAAECLRTRWPAARG